MTLKIFNTLSKKLETFTPLKTGHVGMYVCGVTPYDYCHVGHARQYVFFDTVRKYLEFSGYKVKHVQNFTDVDDKIIARGLEAKRDPLELASGFIEQYFTDMDALNIRRVDVYPKVTEHMADIVAGVEKLIANKHAYVVDGEVFYSVRSFPSYGKLSRREMEELRKSAGSRVEVDAKKRDPLDFTLWKPAKEGEPFWESPWGHGRPGWHIECSVMSQKYLGSTLDIHGGGQDLVFPHHENEIAQAEGISGKPFVKYWMHNEFVNISGEKMSKSLKNFTTVKDALTLWKPDVIRFFILSTHYRKPINFTEEALAAAKEGLARVYNSREIVKDEIDTAPAGAADKAVLAELERVRKKFTEEMDNDFSTPGAISVMFELAKYVNKDVAGKGLSKETLGAILELFEELGSILGIISEREETSDELKKTVEELIAKRETARKRKDFTAADLIRDKLKELGVELEDNKGGARWKVKR